MEATRVAKLVDNEEDFGGPPCHYCDDLSPVRLKLTTRIGLEAHGSSSSAWAECSFGSNVLTQDGMAAGVAFGLYLP